MHMYTHSHTHIQIFMHTHIHIHIHTHFGFLSSPPPYAGLELRSRGSSRSLWSLGSGTPGFWSTVAKLHPLSKSLHPCTPQYHHSTGASGKSSPDVQACFINSNMSTEYHQMSCEVQDKQAVRKKAVKVAEAHVLHLGRGGRWNSPGRSAGGHHNLPSGREGSWLEPHTSAEATPAL